MKQKTKPRPAQQKSKFEREVNARERLLNLSRRMNANPLYSTIEQFVKDKNLEDFKT
jgi:hypothetical protein